MSSGGYDSDRLAARSYGVISGASIYYSSSNKWCKHCVTGIPLILHYKEFLNIHINLTQLGQEHDQHIHQVSNGYAYKFPFIYLVVGNHIPHVFGLHGNETAS